jgi:hypothetical protein
MRLSSTMLVAAVTALSATMSLAGCSAQAVDRTKIQTEPHFWERADATSAIYQRGPKAQQMLNRDISRCVVEIHELERLGAIRQATPAELAMEDAVSNDPDSAEGALARWQTPDHDGNLRAEFLPYHDFETCMINKGWQRVEHVPYEVADEGREVYYDTILGQQYRTKHDLRPQLAPAKPAPYSSVNQ